MGERGGIGEGKPRLYSFSDNYSITHRAAGREGTCLHVCAKSTKKGIDASGGERESVFSLVAFSPSFCALFRLVFSSTQFFAFLVATLRLPSLSTSHSLLALLRSKPEDRRKRASHCFRPFLVPVPPRPSPPLASPAGPPRFSLGAWGASSETRRREGGPESAKTLG